jgi:DNA repair exonuclease SbcCD ATPase subunit
MTATTKAPAKASAKTNAAATAELFPAITTETAPQETGATTAPDGAIVPAGETTAISRWEAIACDIAIAGEKAPTKVFDYRDEWDNKQARSWVHGLRLLKGKIERARKDAKAVHLERGKAVDETAKTLETAVQGMIEPHETAIKALEAEEQARIDAHRAVLDRIAALADAAPVEGEAGIIDVDARLAELAAIDTSALEEFAQAGLNRQAEAIEQLGMLRDKLEAQEAQRIELEALRAQAAAREDADRIARLQQEAVEADRLAREQEAAARVAEAEEQARKDREAAATREAQALAQVEAARQAQAEAEARAKEAAEREEARVKLEAEAAELLQQQTILKATAFEKARHQRRDGFKQALINLLITMDPAAAACAIADGTLHPAVKVDWALIA